MERMTGFVHIDGDAVSKRVNWDIRNGLTKVRSGYLVFDELLETIQVVLQLGFSVIATYVFSAEAIEKFETKLSELGVPCRVVVLQTDPDICIKRDQIRTCWTAGEVFVMQYLDQQRMIAACGRWPVVDNSFIGINETCQIILQHLSPVSNRINTFSEHLQSNGVLL